MNHLKLFVVSGALGVGKSTIAETLIARKSDKYIIISGDLCNIMAFPGVISECRKSWVDMCFRISAQTDRPVVFYVDLTPDAFDAIDEQKRNLMHFVSIVCDEETLKSRVEAKLGDVAYKKFPIPISHGLIWPCFAIGYIGGKRNISTHKWIDWTPQN